MILENFCRLGPSPGNHTYKRTGTCTRQATRRLRQHPQLNLLEVCEVLMRTMPCGFFGLSALGACSERRPLPSNRLWQGTGPREATTLAATIRLDYVPSSMTSSISLRRRRNWATGMWHRHAANFKQHARAIIRSWLLLQTGALLALLRRGIRRCWQSPMGGAKRCPRILALLCLAYSLIGTATAHPSHGKPAPRSERAIREAEIEQWRHGLLTTREQMVRAWDRVLLEAPLTHSGGAVPDPGL